MSLTTEQRKQVRSYFFPREIPKKPSKPKRRFNRTLRIVGVLLVIIGIPLLIVGVITHFEVWRLIPEDFTSQLTTNLLDIYKNISSSLASLQPSGLLFIIGGGAGIVAGVILNVLGRVRHEQYERAAFEYEHDSDIFKNRRKEFEDMLKRWGITEADLHYPPSGQQIDQWLNQEIHDMVQHEVDRLDITEQSQTQPIISYSPLLSQNINGIPHEEIVAIIDENERIVRFSCHEIFMFYPLIHRLIIFTCTFNFLRSVGLNVNKREYSYRDIVGIQEREISTNYSLPDGQKLTRARTLQIDISNGKDIDIVISIPEIQDKYGSDYRISDHVDSLKQLRALWREKADLRS